MNVIPRITFILSGLVLNMIQRSLHCHAGKPQSWFLPPNWS
ncbi:MAG: hypothetical protein SNJ84_00035 [Verrucomicrobiia bacterium]